MDDEKKKLIRIDPHKVQQKLYEMYPANSQVRKRVLSEAKEKEIAFLNQTIDTVPVHIAQEGVKRNWQLLISAGIAGVILAIGAIGFTIYGLLFSKTLIEELFALHLALGYSFVSITYIKESITLYKVSTAFTDSLNTLKKRLEDLKK